MKLLSCMKKLFIFIIPKLPNWFLNWLIYLSSKRTKAIEGSPDKYYERPYSNPLGLNVDEKWREFLIGSVKGIYFTTDKTYNIVAIQNTKGGNGHFEKAVKWFENSAKRDKYKIAFLETMNPKLGKWLTKQGYIKNENNYIKSFNF